MFTLLSYLLLVLQVSESTIAPRAQNINELIWEKVLPQPPGIKPIFDQVCMTIQNGSNNELLMYAGDYFPNGSFTNNLRYFTFATRTWRLGEQHSLSYLPPARGAPATLLHDGVMLVFGGAQEPAESLGDTWEFDIALSMWTEYTAGVDKGPSRRYASSLVWAGQLNCALLFGGSYWLDKLYYNDMWCYKFLQHKWSEILAAGSSPSPRFAHVAAVYENFMYVYGGANDESDQLSDLFALHLDILKWSKVMTSTPPGRAWMQAVIMDKYWIVVGGASNRTDNIDVWKWNFDPASAQGPWQELQASGTQPEKRMAHCSVIHDKALFVVGGYSYERESSVNDTWKLNLTLTTEPTSDPQLPF